MAIEKFSGVLLISVDARRLRDFYADVLGLSLQDEVHEGVPLHYACELGDAHFAIHPADGWPGQATKNAQSPVVLFNTADAAGLAAKLTAAGIENGGAVDHGFAYVVAFRDPDGNLIEVLQNKQ